MVYCWCRHLLDIFLGWNLVLTGMQSHLVMKIETIAIGDIMEYFTQRLYIIMD